jgi:hypothetical protein
MTWVRTDDAMPLHPKVLALSDGAYRLLMNALAFANRATTNGLIPASLLPTLDHRRAWSVRQIEGFAGELVAANLWKERPSGYEIHDYAEYQEEALKDAKEARKVAARDRKRAQRIRDKLAKPGGSHAVTPRDKECDTKRDIPCDTTRDQVRDIPRDQPRDPAGDSAEVRSAMSQPPVPSRPVPSRSEHKNNIMSADAPTEPEVGPASGSVRVVFDHWREVFGKNAAAKLDPKRRRRIEWAVRTYTVDVVKRCIDGYARSAWHRGENERGVVYDDLELLLRDAKHVEAGLALADGKGRGLGRQAPVRPDPARALESQRRALALFGGEPEEVTRG